MIPDLKHVRGFLKIAQLHNFTRAAKALHLSQSALTVQIKQLEATLGITLFDRGRRGVTLTAAGREVLGPLERLVAEAERIVSHAHNITSINAGSITVAALPSISAELLPGVVRQFLTKYDGVRITIHDVSPDRVRNAVATRQADFGIGTVEADQRLEPTFIFRDNLILVVPPSHPFARQKSISLRDLPSERIILPSRESDVRRMIDASLHTEKIALNPFFETNLIPTALGMVRNQLGLAILPGSVVRNDVPGYISIPLQRPALHTEIQLLQLKGTILSPAAAAFARFVKTGLSKQSRQRL